VLAAIISRHLGLRGFGLALEAEKANTPEEIRAIAERTLQQIGMYKGEAAEAEARQALEGALTLESR
jgi:hypothetical protein